MRGQTVASLEKLRRGWSLAGLQKELSDTATWTGQIFDGQAPCPQDGQYPHLLGLAAWSTTKLTALSRVRDLGLRLGIPGPDVAQLGAQVTDSHSGVPPDESANLVMLARLIQESKTVTQEPAFKWVNGQLVGIKVWGFLLFSE